MSGAPTSQCNIWKATPQEAREELLGYVTEVRQNLHKELAALPQGARLSRLCLSDIAETLAVRAMRSIMGDTQFPENAPKFEKKLFITTCLRISLVHWLMSRAETEQELALVNCIKLPTGSH